MENEFVRIEATSGNTGRRICIVKDTDLTFDIQRVIIPYNDLSTVRNLIALLERTENFTLGEDSTSKEAPKSNVNKVKFGEKSW